MHMSICPPKIMIRNRLVAVVCAGVSSIAADMNKYTAKVDTTIIDIRIHSMFLKPSFINIPLIVLSAAAECCAVPGGRAHC